MDNIHVRDYGDDNKVLTELVKILRSEIFDRDLQMKGIMSTTGPLASMSWFLHKLQHCSGENAEKLHNHLKQSKLKTKGFGVDPNSREAVKVAVSSFTEHLSNWSADHADEIFKLGYIGALTAYIQVTFSNEDLEDMNLYSLIKIIFIC